MRQAWDRYPRLDHVTKLRLHDLRESITHPCDLFSNSNQDPLSAAPTYFACGLLDTLGVSPRLQC